jgi:hypothetical protein
VDNGWQQRFVEQIHISPYFQLFKRVASELHIRHRILRSLGIFIVGAMVQQTACLGPAHAAPLLEKEGDVCVLAIGVPETA